jgi:UDP-N-acetyl-D-mannosaminuronic acid dehydrogenase
VLTTDPYVTVDPSLVPLDQVLNEADLLIIGSPHRVYRDIVTDLPIVDIWNLRERGVQI